MDYSKLTKPELLELVTAQQTLSDAVSVKDKEINRLNDRIHFLEQQIKDYMPQDEVKRKVGQLEEDVKKARSVANMYIQSHRDLMRVLKVNLDIAIAHEDLLTEKIKKGE